MTNGSEKGVIQFLEETHSRGMFDLIISIEAHATERSSSEVFKPLSDRYDVKPEDATVVGDINNSMKTKVDARLGLAIGVLSGTTKEEELVDADYVIETAVSAPEVLEKYT